MNATALTSDAGLDPNVAQPRWEGVTLTDQTSGISISPGR